MLPRRRLVSSVLRTIRFFAKSSRTTSFFMCTTLNALRRTIPGPYRNSMFLFLFFHTQEYSYVPTLFHTTSVLAWMSRFLDCSRRFLVSRPILMDPFPPLLLLPPLYPPPPDYSPIFLLLLS